jgi:hypothetical protein
MLVTPITPGLFYLWWIGAYQFAGVATPGAAVSNIAFHFGPVVSPSARGLEPKLATRVGTLSSSPADELMPRSGPARSTPLLSRA